MDGFPAEDLAECILGLARIHGIAVESLDEAFGAMAGKLGSCDDSSVLSTLAWSVSRLKQYRNYLPPPV